MRLFHKLLLLLGGLVALPLALSTGVVAWRADALKSALVDRSRASGSAAADLSQDALYEQARRNQLEIVRSKAQLVEDFFESVRQAVMLLAATTEESLLEEAPAPGKAAPQWTADEVAAKLEAGGDFKESVYRLRPYTMYHVTKTVDPKIVDEDRKRLSRLAGVFGFLLREYKWIDSVYVGHADGVVVGYPGGSRFSGDYDPRTRYWYLKAEKKGLVNWTKIYLDRTGTKLLMTCTMPVYRDGRMIAVAAVDIKLDKIVSDLFDLRQLPVKSALLVDHKKQIRVASDYKWKQKIVSYDAKLEPLLIDKFGDGLFGKVFEGIKGSDSGIAVLDVPGGDDVQGTRDLFAYAKVDVRANYEDGMRWYYVLRMPIDPIIKPVWKVREDLDVMSGELSGAIDSEVRRLRGQLALVGILVLLAALAAAARAARTAARPLVEMAEAVDKIGKGDFSQRVPVRSRDELGEVARAINDMAHGLEDAIEVKGAFKRYVSASVVDEILKDPKKVRLGGERREMTVFFSDIAGFSTLAEKMPPEQLVELINEYLSEMTDLIFAHRGTLDKYEGDAIMCFWNAPIEQPDHALRACRAALDNLAALKRLQAAWSDRGLTGFEIRIGINTGPMVVGNMGSPSRLEYTVLGDSVNVGARLEQENKKFGTRIMISESTLRSAGEENLNVRELGEVVVKGRQQPVKVYELLGLRKTAAA